MGTASGYTTHSFYGVRGGSVDMAMSPAIQHVAPTDIERKVTATASEGNAGFGVYHGEIMTGHTHISS